MTATEKSNGLARLRDPFEPAQIGQLPKPYKADSPKGTCPVCKGYHGLPAAHLDYVGHAALTDRFLEVDPAWTWEPMATDASGAPAFDANGGIWIRLTILGVTKPGYGDAQGKKGGNAVKEAIGDALRNAGMRFGAALDLWHKGDMHDAEEARGTEAPEPLPTVEPPSGWREQIAALETAADFQAFYERATAGNWYTDVVKLAMKARHKQVEEATAA